MKLTDIKDPAKRKRFQNALENIPCAQIPDTKPCERATPLEGSDEGKTPGAGCPLVSFALSRVKLLDVDAKYSSVKDLLDGLTIAGLIPGDKEGQVTLEVHQHKVKSYAEEWTEITITYEP